MLITMLSDYTFKNKAFQRNVEYEVTDDTAAALFAAGVARVATQADYQPVAFARIDPSTGAVLDGFGNPIALAGSPGVFDDRLVAPLQRVTITGALSTSLTQTATATGTYYKARVVWNNNGASTSAKLYIAVNADNAVHGLVIGQSAKRRNHEMTMGDGVILVCGVPITSLTFSSDVSITGGTHQLQVTFGN